MRVGVAGSFGVESWNCRLFTARALSGPHRREPMDCSGGLRLRKRRKISAKSLATAPDTIEKLLSVLSAFGHAQVNAAAANDRGRVRLITELILREELKVLRRCFKYERLAAHIRGVNPIADHHRRREDFTAQPLFP